MKKVITLSTVAATLLVGAPVTAVNADTITTKETKPYTQTIDLNNVLFSYFNLPSLNTTNGKIDLSKFGIDMAKLQEAIKQQVAAQKPTTGSNNSTTKPTVPSTPAKPTTPPVAEKPATPVEKPAAPAEKPAAPAEKPSTSTALNAYENKVFELTNVERTKNGLKPFTLNVELSKVARIKSQDMTDKNYFDHNSPTYGSPFDMMKKFGISYNYAAENIAKGQRTPEEVVTAWMNSAGHRANILNPNLTQIGVGYDSRANTWTQQFIGK